MYMLKFPFILIPKVLFLQCIQDSFNSDLIRHIDIEMTVMRKKFILRDSKKQEEEHVLQGHTGKHQSHSEGRGLEENAQKVGEGGRG